MGKKEEKEKKEEEEEEKKKKEEKKGLWIIFGTGKFLIHFYSFC